MSENATRNLMLGMISAGLLFVMGPILIMLMTGLSVTSLLSANSSMIGRLQAEGYYIGGQWSAVPAGLTCNSLPVTLYGFIENGVHPIVFHGTDGDDVIYIDDDDLPDPDKVWVYGHEGDDTICTNDTDDAVIWGGSGDDWILSGGGEDWIKGQNGTDTIDAGNGNNSVWGGSGADTITTGGAHDLIMGDSGDDIINSGGGDDMILGGTGDDTIDGEGDDDRIDGEEGDDNIDCGGGTGDVGIGGEEAESAGDTHTGASCETALEFEL